MIQMTSKFDFAN